MKTATTIILGIFCFFNFLACKCDPDDETPDKKESTNNDNSHNTSNKSRPENDTVLVKR